MSPNRHGTQVVSTRASSRSSRLGVRCSIGLVFDVLTKPEHVQRWCATGGDRVTICEIDLRVGGDFHHVFVAPGRNGVLVPRDLRGDRAADSVWSTPGSSKDGLMPGPLRPMR